MQIRPLTRSEVRAIDVRAAQELGLPTLLLMENAGAQVAHWLRRWAKAHDRFLFICGPGNNGGDAAVAARHLDGWGYRIQVAWCADPEQLKGDAALHRTILERARIEQLWLGSDSFESVDWTSDWIVDGLLGTGLTRPVEGLFLRVIEQINRCKQPVLAIDLPSGLDADLGQPLGLAVKAKATITFVAPKVGFSALGADQYTGEVFVADIGLPRCLLESYRNVATEPMPRSTT